LLNDKYISGYDTMLPTTTGVTKSDIMEQLPESAGWVVLNSPRSFWLTARYDFYLHLAATSSLADEEGRTDEAS